MANNPLEQLKDRVLNLDMYATVEAANFVINEDGSVTVKNRVHHDEL